MTHSNSEIFEASESKGIRFSWDFSTAKLVSVEFENVLDRE
jgi:hypothetical protein